MKVVMNAVSAKMGGAVTYLTNVLRCLPPPESGWDFTVFLPPETGAKQKNLASNIHLIPTRIGHASWWKRLWWEQVTLRRTLRRMHADALYSTANFGMFRCPVRQMLLVRIPLYFSKIYLDTFFPRHSFKERVAFRLRRWLCCQSVRWADLVMTPTQAMLDELREFVDVPPDKGVVNFYGVAQAARGEMGDSSLGANTSTVRLLYVSLYCEHKNLTALLKALPLLNKEEARKFVLVTTANPAWKVENWSLTRKTDLELAQRPDTAPWVKFVGPLGPEEVKEQYRNTDIFVFPAMTESFGHPMVEAMVHGLPVVASDTPINREICGEGAVYFNLSSPEELARQVTRVASDAELRAKLTACGRERTTSQFLWENHARKMVAALDPRNVGPGNRKSVVNGTAAFPSPYQNPAR